MDKQPTLSQVGSREQALQDFTKTMQTLPVNKTATPFEAHQHKVWLEKQKQKNA
jgi:hypothetical protein